MNFLNQWQNFYVIVGSAAGALTGLQFVVMALMADLPKMESESDGVSAFSTPSIVNFGVVLMLSSVLVMPWKGLGALSVVWAVAGLAGILYTARNGARFSKQKAYKPVFEDYFYPCHSADCRLLRPGRLVVYGPTQHDCGAVSGGRGRAAAVVPGHS